MKISHLERQLPQGPPAAHAALARRHPVDVLCLQETKLTDDKFPVAEIEAAGYHVGFSGQKTYNGVGILSAPS